MRIETLKNEMEIYRTTHREVKCKFSLIVYSINYNNIICAMGCQMRILTHYALNYTK